MKKFYLMAILCILGWTNAMAQIPDGSIAPDFTGTDINGETHHLYDLLEAGKTVFMDVSATWCGPCWNYHNSHALKNLWEERGPNGTDEVFVLFIEGDGSTNTACLYGPSGCNSSTQGDWVTDTPYPIIDDASIANMYQISYFPTVFCICPLDKKVYEAGTLSASGLWNFAQSKCAPPPVAYTLNSTRNVKCYGTSTGAIDITPAGGLGASSYTYVWSNGATTQDLNNVPAGTYTVSITSGGVTIESDPIDVIQPDAPLSVEVVDFQPVGCNSVLGSITVAGSGGWDSEYLFNWQNGQLGETANGLAAGTYRVTLTDADGCTTTASHTLEPPVQPVSHIATPQMITCNLPTIQLNGTGSDSGDDIAYQWFVSNGGNIVSGGTTNTPTVNAAGGYTIQVTNTATTCVSFKTVTVAADQTYPTANAGAAGTVSCPVPLDTLAGTGSNGSIYTYNWTGANVVSGGNTLTPVVGAPGVYTLAVTNTTNGCTQTSTTSVTGFNTPPSIATAGGVLSCTNGSVVLNTTTGSSNPTFSWTGPNGYASNVQSPTVSVSGTYNLVVNDTITGCSNNASANVTANTLPPAVAATAGNLTCVIANATVAATTPDTNAVYAWTGPNGFTSSLPSFSVNEAGAYNLVLSDPDNGCTATAVATVVSNTAPPTASAVTPGNLNCNTAQIQLNGTGSSQGTNFTYNWTTTDGNIVSGGDGQTPIVDAVGTYQLQVNNTENGCNATSSVAVVQSAAVNATATHSNVACFGGANGAATAVGTGGNGNYSYSWSNGATTATAEGLIAGAYQVVITDNENCTAVASVTIAQPDLLAANATATAQSANGVNDGTATANPAGGTSGYSFSWSTGATTQTITDLAPGTYTVVVTDANGCTVEQLVTVNSFNCALAANVEGTNLSCFGANNGSAAVTYLGGAEPLTFQWSNGATTQQVTSLAGGMYTVNVMDANNCPATLNITILEPAQLLANATATGVTSSSSNDGTATANPTGGAGVYTYLWSTGATTQTISDLAPGVYSVAVTDENGCVSIQDVVVGAFSCFIAADNSVTHVSCAGVANGAISVVLNGGEAPFTYSWSNGSTDASLSNLSGGVYTAIITDANACQVINTVTINEPQPFSAWDVQVVNTICPNDASGSAEAFISGATAPYTFLWSNGVTGSSLSNVLPGAYSVQATDANGCTSSTAVDILSNDTEAPTVSAQPATVTLDNAGNAAISLQTVNAQFADNCAVASAVVTPALLNCSSLGAQQVTVTVTDLAGHVSTTTTTVTVVDAQAPVLTCPANIVVCPDASFVTYPSAVAQDNCLSSNGQWNQTAGLPSPSNFPEGTTTQTFTFTDASGNVGTCSFTVTVTSSVVFEDVTVKNDQNGLGVGSIDITVFGGVAPYTYSWLLDGTQIATTQDATGLNAGEYTVVITDTNGCTFTHSGIVLTNSVATQEPAWLKGVSLQPNPTSSVTQLVFAQVLETPLELTVIDATGRILHAQMLDQVSTATIPCTDMPSGMYTIRLRSNKEVGTRKLMVIK